MKAANSVVGTYLGRPVSLAIVHSASEISSLELSQSLLFLAIAAPALSDQEQRELVDVVIRSRPLGVFAQGPAAESFFDVLVEALGQEDPAPEVTTNFSPEAAEEAR